MSNLSGKLIVIEGLDGSGKATQTALLVERLHKEKIPTETIDFPQYTQNFFGGVIRNYLHNEYGPATKIDPHLSSVLYAADRWESSEKIKAWQAAGKTIILDRYVTSNLIHQTPKLPEDKIDAFIEWISKMEFEVFKIPKPDHVIYLHVDAQISFDLITKRGQGHDGHDQLDYMTLTEQRCRHLAEKLQWHTIECCEQNQILPIETIHEKIWEVVKNF